MGRGGRREEGRREGKGVKEERREGRGRKGEGRGRGGEEEWGEE